MLIAKVNLYQIILPFADDFSHSLKKEGVSSASVVVEVVCADGIRGYGEAAPRPYVTGETPQTAFNSLVRFIRQDEFPWDLLDVSQIWSFVDAQPAGKFQNAAICAIEMALLDALGKTQNVSLLEYFPKTFYTDSIHYGAAIHLSAEEKVRERCKLIRRLGIRQVRIKMDEDYQRNRRTIEAVMSILGPTCDLRIDVNGAWDYELALLHVPLMKAYPVSVVEQPLDPQSTVLSKFAGKIKPHGIHVMADEAACSLEDIHRIHTDGCYDMINVRLSKCGGFRRAMEMIDFLRRHRLYFQIGCQLGETGLLSAAGRVLSLLCKDALYYDGCYDRFLLKENITTENVTFGHGGFAGPLNGAGLGVDVNPQSLDRLSVGLARETQLRP